MHNAWTVVSFFFEVIFLALWAWGSSSVGLFHAHQSEAKNKNKMLFLALPSLKMVVSDFYVNENESTDLQVYFSIDADLQEMYRNAFPVDFLFNLVKDSPPAFWDSHRAFWNLPLTFHNQIL